MSHLDDPALENALAILAFSGRFPQAPDVERFWDNLRAGTCSITDLDDDDLLAAGVEAATLADPSYVKAAAVLEDAELFDAGFFGFSPREAALLDPQQRLFLECSWEALERSGYDAQRLDAPIGVFAAASLNAYFFYHLYSPHAMLNTPGAAAGLLGGDKDFLATRVSYLLGLRGPSLNVQTACSSSLVAVHLACQSLLNGECDLALAGGVSVRVPQQVGYFHQTDSVLSSDGRCRAFDAAADGTVAGSGVGVVVLKRLDEAMEDGDRIRAVVRGSAINNDGAARVGYTAPGVEGQAAVISEALALARVEPSTVGYIEAHGSGTPLGDPIEVAALTHAFRGEDEDSPSEALAGACGLGSVKTNIGHLDSAAGIAGLIKAALCVEAGEQVPSLGFERPNPKIDFDASPFQVVTEARPWPAEMSPRRAGVSSFGMGGTNAHVVLEEPPSRLPSDPSRPWQLLLLSARSEPAVRSSAESLAEHLGAHPEQQLADVAHTLQAGRRIFAHRRALICRSSEEARELLEAAAAEAPSEANAQRILGGVEERRDRPVAFLFSGLGDHGLGMGRGLYQQEPVFRDVFDEGAEIMAPLLGVNLCDVLDLESPELADADAAAGPDLRALLGRSPQPELGELSRTELAQPALFLFELALAHLWRSWGVEPGALLGYSLGEYAAATIAGVMGREDALALVAHRAQLIAELPSGAMLAVALDEASTRQRLDSVPDLAISALNGPELSVVSGGEEAVTRLEESLGKEGVTCRRVASSHPFHSPRLQPIAERFLARLEEIELRAPEIPLVSNVTGTWLEDSEATDPAYWVRHLLEPVRFADGISTLWGEDPERALLEIGAGSSTASLALQQPIAGASCRVAVASQPAAWEQRPQQAVLLETLGRLWLAGVEIDWNRFVDDEQRCREPLPTYPFERQRYWVEGQSPARTSAAMAELPAEAEVATTRHARPGLATAYEAPRDGRESALAEIWSGLLGIEAVGAHDSFFELGGHSLMATQMLARVRDRFGVELELARVFETPTLAALAEALPSAGASGKGSEDFQGSGSSADSPRQPGTQEAGGAAEPGKGAEGFQGGLPRRQDATRGPMSFAQQRLWFVDRLAPGISAYNNPLAVRFLGLLDVTALDAALAEVIRRHEALRTTFAIEDGTPWQLVQPPARPHLARVDLSSLEPEHRETTATRWVEVIACHPFDLVNGPMLHTALLRLGPEEHLFLAVLHHIISDEWSLAIFVREVGALYAATVAGQPSPLAPLPIQYGDYAAWQRDWLQGDVLESQLNFWRGALDGAPPVLSLPYDHPRPPAQTFQGATQRFAFSNELSERLRQLARDRGVTLFMLLLAGFQALLSRYSGQLDLVVSTGTGNRSRVETEDLIGCFINIVLLRGDLGGDPGFGELLERTRPATLSAFAHQDTPFELLVEAVQPDRDMATAPLTQVMLVLLNVPRSEIELAGLKLRPVPVERSAAQLDLTLYVGEAEDGALFGHLEYAADLFDATTAERLLGHLDLLLERASEDPERPLATLSLLTEPEERLLAELGATSAPFPRDACLHEIVAQRAADTPDAIAIIGDGHGADGWLSEQRWTYGALRRRAARLSAALRERGVGPESRVGLALCRGPAVPAAILGVLEAGAAYVPLDPSYPEDRLRFMLEDAGIAVVLTEQALTDALPATDAERLLLEDVEAAAAPSQTSLTAETTVDVDPENLAYVIYTSGSTGVPKGVAIRHRGVLNNLLDLNASWGEVGPGDSTLLLSSLSFDMSVYETLGMLVAGATVVVPAAGRDRDPIHWADLVARHRVTIWNTAPALLGMLVDELEKRQGSPERRDGDHGDAASLRLAILGGDWVPTSLPERFWAVAGTERSTGPPVTLAVLGGATELSIHSTRTDVTAVDPTWRSIPYGRPMRNQGIRVFDRCLVVCPVGVPGELYLSGVGVARGYAGRPAFTAERFVPDPGLPGGAGLGSQDAGERGARMYRTGDLVRLLGDGQLELLGRIDFQVKVRGVRIELGEVEAALKRHPEVGQAVALVRELGPGDQGLVVWATPGEAAAEDEALDPKNLRDHLKGSLPETMLPARLLVLDALPLTPNGKIDRSALRRRALPEDTGRTAAFTAPRDPAEEALAAIWGEVLGRQQIGVDDDFFELGGHSLLATQVLTRIEETFTLAVPLRDLFDHPTLGALAACLRCHAAEAELDLDEVAGLVLELGGLSDDEVLAMLEEREEIS